jgi:uncharacterized membrane protein
MDTVTVKEGRRSGLSAHRPTAALLGVAMAIAVGFVAFFAIRYFTLNQEVFAFYWPRRGWLLMHIAGGMIALLTGPGQLWLGLNHKHLQLHRRLGVTYMASVAVSSVAAFYLAAHTDLGWVFGAGLTGLAVAWIVTTGLAFVAIRRGLIQQHQEWMIRSYVVTFAFVTFRIFAGVAQAVGVGTLQEQLAAASWFCWAVPLLITEAILQGTKIFNSQVSTLNGQVSKEL